MKISPRLILLCHGVFACCSTVQAKRKRQPAPPEAAALATPPPEPAALPSEAAPHVDPKDPPSTSLQPFVDKHLSSILTPLGTSAFAQPEVLASLKAGYADGMAAAPASHQPAFQLAMGVYDAMNGAITERQNAVAALRGALATRSSEAEQPRGGGQAVATARDKDAFFTDSQKNTWMQRATVLRQNIVVLSLRERAVERQIGVWSPPLPSVSAVAAAPTPSVSAPAAASPQGPDPVVGQWMLAGTAPLLLAADHSISGSRQGKWLYTWTTDGGRNYELHWAHKGWVDYLVLSGDGSRMDGHSRNGKSISAARQ